MIGKFKFVVVSDAEPTVIWDKTQELALAEFQKRKPGKTVQEILPNKEYLRKYKIRKAAAKPTKTVTDGTPATTSTVPEKKAQPVQPDGL